MQFFQVPTDLPTTPSSFHRHSNNLRSRGITGAHSPFHFHGILGDLKIIDTHSCSAEFRDHPHHPIPPTSCRTTGSHVWVAHDVPNLHMRSLAMRWMRVAVEVAVRGPWNGEKATVVLHSCGGAVAVGVSTSIADLGNKSSPLGVLYGMRVQVYGHVPSQPSSRFPGRARPECK